MILSLNRPGNDASILRISALNATLRIGSSSSLQDIGPVRDFSPPFRGEAFALGNSQVELN